MSWLSSERSVTFESEVVLLFGFESRSSETVRRQQLLSFQIITKMINTINQYFLHNYHHNPDHGHRGILTQVLNVSIQPIFGVLQQSIYPTYTDELRNGKNQR